VCACRSTAAHGCVRILANHEQPPWVFMKSCFLHQFIGLFWVLGVLLVPDVRADVYPIPKHGNDLVGQLKDVSAHQQDTLVDIASRNDLGYREVRIANPSIDPWLPGQGTRVVLPSSHILPDAPRYGLVLNVAEMRLYYYPKGSDVVQTYPVSIGRQDWRTPEVNTRIVAKQQDPAWHPPASIRAEHAADGDILPERVAPGEDNPLGKYALRLGLPGYLIHGTNKVYGIGMQVTHGCVRLYPDDIETLFREVPVGTSVHIVNQPYKAGWRNGMLYLEVHPPLEGAPAEARLNETPLVRVLVAATREHPDYPINWDRVREVAREANGVPIPVGPPMPETTAVQAKR
jgi:L,D-transpeptidase ErfK/SrfK